MSEYDWKEDPFLDLDGLFDCDPAGEAGAREGSVPINHDAANARSAEELLGKTNVYRKVRHSGDAEYDRRVKVGDEVVFTRAGYYALSFPGVDGETVTASTNHVMYTVVGRKPAVYGAVHIQDFGPAHEPVGMRVGEKEVAEFNATRHVTPEKVGATAGEFRSLAGLLNYKKN